LRGVGGMAEQSVGSIVQSVWALLIELSATEFVALVCAVLPAVSVFRVCMRLMINMEPQEDEGEAKGNDSTAALSTMSHEIASLRREVKMLRTKLADGSIGTGNADNQISSPPPPQRSACLNHARACSCVPQRAVAEVGGCCAIESVSPSVVVPVPRVPMQASPVEALSVGGARYWRSPSSQPAHPPVPHRHSISDWRRTCNDV